MPRNLSDEAFDALRITVREIDFRAKRLTEWRMLGLNTQNSESRFDVFVAKHKGAGDPPSNEQLTDLKNAWTDCDRQLIELSFLPDGFMAITLTLLDGSQDATVKTWIDALVAAGNQVGIDLGKKSFEDLKTHIADYKAAYTKISIQRDAKVQLEVNQLATLTNGLKLKFDNVL